MTNSTEGAAVPSSSTEGAASAPMLSTEGAEVSPLRGRGAHEATDVIEHLQSDVDATLPKWRKVR